MEHNGAVITKLLHSLTISLINLSEFALVQW